MHLHKPAYTGLTRKIKYGKFLMEIGNDLAPLPPHGLP